MDIDSGIINWTLFTRAEFPKTNPAQCFFFFTIRLRGQLGKPHVLLVLFFKNRIQET